MRLLAAGRHDGVDLMCQVLTHANGLHPLVAHVAGVFVN